MASRGPVPGPGAGPRELATSPCPRYHRCPTDGKWVLTDTPFELFKGRRRPQDTQGAAVRVVHLKRFNKGVSRRARRLARERSTAASATRPATAGPSAADGSDGCGPRARELGLSFTSAVAALCAGDSLSGAAQPPGDSPKAMAQSLIAGVRTGDQRNITYRELRQLMSRPRSYNILSNRVGHEQDFASGLRRNGDKQPNVPAPSIGEARSGLPARWARNPLERVMGVEEPAPGRAIFAGVHKNSTSAANMTLQRDPEDVPATFHRRGGSVPGGSLSRRELRSLRQSLLMLHLGGVSPGELQHSRLRGQTIQRPASALA
eukprot:TRINITY_DN21163_c0_g1_i1.p1 TRINITY_DN21163_c0_g1~~TRINITY_DN21163_c0_g1_i1.p1  ORF type:complete len:319 (+),score=55.26 TRINITY_DN21163_c0_g1_i1:67-1023(+)